MTNKTVKVELTREEIVALVDPVLAMYQEWDTFDTDDRPTVQSALAKLGYDPSIVDGV